MVAAVYDQFTRCLNFLRLWHKHILTQALQFDLSLTAGAKDLMRGTVTKYPLIMQWLLCDCGHYSFCMGLISPLIPQSFEYHILNLLWKYQQCGRWAAIRCAGNIKSSAHNNWGCGQRGCPGSHWKRAGICVSMVDIKMRWRRVLLCQFINQCGNNCCV